MKFNLAKLFQHIVAEIETIKKIGEHAEHLIGDAKAIWELVSDAIARFVDDEGRVVMSASEADAIAIAEQHPIVNSLAAACVEFDSVDEMTAMRGPGAILQLLKLLAQYGPLILELIDALEDD